MAYPEFITREPKPRSSRHDDPRHVETSTATYPVDRGRKSSLALRSRPVDNSQDLGGDGDYDRSRARDRGSARERPRSRVRLVVSDSESSSDDDRRGRQRGFRDGETRIRATSRPGEPLRSDLVRKGSQRGHQRPTGAPVFHDLELKTDPRYREFQQRRDMLERIEGTALKRARSRGYDDWSDDESDLRSYHSRDRPQPSRSDDYRSKDKDSAVSGPDRNEDRRRYSRQKVGYKGQDFDQADRHVDRPKSYTTRRRVSVSPKSTRSSLDDGSDFVFVSRPGSYNSPENDAILRRVISPRDAPYPDMQRAVDPRDRHPLDRDRKQRDERDREIVIMRNRQDPGSAMVGGRQRYDENRQRGTIWQEPKDSPRDQPQTPRSREYRTRNDGRVTLEKDRLPKDFSARSSVLRNERAMDPRPSRGASVLENERFVDAQSRTRGSFLPSEKLSDAQLSPRGGLPLESERFVDASPKFRGSSVMENERFLDDRSTISGRSSDTYAGEHYLSADDRMGLSEVSVPRESRSRHSGSHWSEAGIGQREGRKYHRQDRPRDWHFVER